MKKMLETKFILLCIMLAPILFGCENDCNENVNIFCGQGTIAIIKCDKISKKEILDFEVHVIPIDYDELPNLIYEQRIYSFKNNNYLCLNKTELCKKFSVTEKDSLLCYYNQKGVHKTFLMPMSKDKIYLYQNK